jgi:SAM-dependent methyltransferase
LIDPAAAGFGDQAAAYESGRPTYPAAALDRAVEQLGPTPDATVADIAAGTGKLTRLLTERFAEVIAVEPLDGMRGVLERAVPDATIMSGTAEATGLEDGRVDAVFVGEAFHWFDEPAAIAEFDRVLRPGGGIALLWNLERWDGDKYPWLERFGELVGGHRRADYSGQRGGWTASEAVAGLFEAPAQVGFPHTHRVDADGFIEMISSWSWIAALEPEQRSEALGAVRAMLADEGIAEVALDYETTVVTARKAPPDPARSPGS